MSGIQGQPMCLDDLVALARERAGRGRRYVLGITGAPGAGKSTVAEALVGRLGGDVAVLVGQDGFHLANQVLLDLGRRERKGSFDTYDVPGYAVLLATVAGQHELALVDGEVPVIYGPTFRREIEEPIGSSVPVCPEVPLVVTEGNYLLLDRGGWPAAAQHIDEVWFLAPDEDVRMSRLVTRHQQFGRGPEEAVSWARGPDQVNAVMIEGTAPAADLVITMID